MERNINNLTLRGLKILRRISPFYRAAQWFYMNTVERGRRSKRFVRSRYYKELKRLSKFIVDNGFRGGLITDQGEFYVKMPDDILVFYNFAEPEFTLGEGQNLDSLGAILDPVAEILFAIMANEGTYVDVGANNGYFYTLQIANRFNRSSIYAFEPNPKILLHLRKNVSINRCNNIQVIPTAVTDFTGSALLAFDLGANSFLPEKASSPHETLEVDCITFDQFLLENKINKVDVIKLDIEGGEHKFLLGAKGMLETKPPILIMELKDKFLRRSGSSKAKLLEFLKTNGYTVYGITGTEDVICFPQKDRISMKELTNRGLHKQLAQV